MGRDWEQFQQQVARIEAFLKPQGAVVTTPDHIPDVNTGQPREVDASIRMRLGASDILVTFECRKRKDKQDVTWIEQLATKKKNIGADRTVAVSSKGFSAAAKDTARRYGIELRCLMDLSTQDEVVQWLRGIAMTIELRDFLVRYCTLWTSDGGRVDMEDLPVGVQEKVRQHGLSELILLELPSRRQFSVKEIFEREKVSSLLSQSSVPVPAVVIKFPPGRVAVSAREGERELSRIDFHVEWRRDRKSVNPSTLERYAGKEGPIMDVAGGEVGFEDGTVIEFDILMDANGTPGGDMTVP